MNQLIYLAGLIVVSVDGGGACRLTGVVKTTFAGDNKGDNDGNAFDYGPHG